MKKLYILFVLACLMILFTNNIVANPTFYNPDADEFKNQALITNPAMSEPFKSTYGHDDDPTTMDKEARHVVVLSYSKAPKVSFKSTSFDAATKLSDTYQAVCAFNIENNTQDGFKVYLMSSNGGKLLPTDGENVHGETKIDYTLKIDVGQNDALDNIVGKTRNATGLGSGANNFNPVGPTELQADTEHVIFSNAESSVTKATQQTFTVSVALGTSDNGDGSFERVDGQGYELAGTYKDSLVVVYQDF